MLGTVFKRISFLLKENCPAWILGLLRGQSSKLEDGWENRVVMDRLREDLYSRAKLGSG